MADAPARLVVCPSLERYAERTAKAEPGDHEIPIVGRPARLFGFPPGSRCVDSSSVRTGSSTPSALTPESGVCVVVDEPTCRVAGRLLATMTGRHEVVIDESMAFESVDVLLSTCSPKSLTFVLPLWGDADGELDPRWIARVLAYVRGRAERLVGLPWGMILGADGPQLSLVVARAILAPSIVAAYADEPAAMFVTQAAEAIGSALPRMPASADEHGVAPLQIVDLDHVRSGAALQLCERRYSALLMSGHGRAYCGQLGHLCGARALSVEPDAPAPRCVEGLTCVSPEDGSRGPQTPAFPRIDPRRYDAPIMILESCVAGGWASPEWDSGLPSIAIHAFSGAASAVICSDFATMVSAAKHVEPLAALRAAETIGEAVARLNRARAGEVGGALRYLIGDPELPLRFSRWSSWSGPPLAEERARDPEAQTIRARVDRDRPFATIELGLHDASDTTTYVRTEPENSAVGGVHLVDASGEPSLWVALKPDGPGEARETVELHIETQATPRLPPGLLDAALIVPLLTRSWSEALRVHAVPLLQAAARIEAVADRLDRVRGQALLGEHDSLRAGVLLCREAWVDAHLQAVQAACDLADRGLREDRLWRGTDYHSDTSEAPCPYCGITPTLERRYRSPPALARSQWECVACTLIQDRPSVPTPELSLSMPRRIDPGETIEAQLRLDNRGGEHHFAVAGALLVDRDGHGVEVPPPFAVELAPGEVHERTIELRSTGRPAIAHRYYARAPILSNGVWTLAARLLTVGP